MSTANKIGAAGLLITVIGLIYTLFPLQIQQIFISYNNEKFIKMPIDNLFNSWGELDINKYLKQWDAHSHQMDNGKEYNFNQIKEQRIRLFSQLSSVIVKPYTVEIVSKHDSIARVFVHYDMAFNYKNNQTKTEKEDEAYDLVYHKQTNAWLIRTNYDYLKK